MHELSIAMSILELAQEEAERRRCRIEAIHVEVGVLSGVVPDAVVYAYELAREETEFETCRLVIEDVPVVGYCPACETDRPARSSNWLRCAQCDGPLSEVRQGRELQVSALELCE